MQHILFLMLALFLTLRRLAAGDDEQETAPEQIDPQTVKGKPEQDLVKVRNARYFVWHDGSGWHLRTASRGLAKYGGPIQLKGGSFGKLRAIGLERKAKRSDRWAVNEDRTELRFEIHTAG
jgi:hypothetical protein